MKLRDVKKSKTKSNTDNISKNKHAIEEAQNKNSKENNILDGTIWKAILYFFFPILIGTFFQQLYNTVDASIVGIYAGKEALSSVGGSSSIIVNLVIGFFTGLSAGCTVLISQYYGAKDSRSLDKALHTSYAFGITGGIVLGLIGIVLSPMVLKLMSTPEELMHDSVLYLRIYFAGLAFVFIYNMGAAILRALGDSTRPLVYLIISTVINIILDLIFVAYFKMGVFGVAFATFLSQAISALMVTECLMRRTAAVKLILKKIRFDYDVLAKMIRIGLPSGIQASTYSLSNMFIQYAINMFGVNTVAAWTIVGKVDVIFWMINGSFGIAAATFVGQNFGANNMTRIKKGVRTCLAMALVTAFIVSGLLLAFGQYTFRLFTSDSEVISIAIHMLFLIVPAYFVFVFIEIFSSALRAEGNTIIPTIINVVGIVIYRIIWISIFGTKGNLDIVLYCYPISWIMCAIVITIYYAHTRKAYK